MKATALLSLCPSALLLLAVPVASLAQDRPCPGIELGRDDRNRVLAPERAPQLEKTSKEPSCTFGKDQTCNDDALMSSLQGHCEADGTCTCRVGYAVNPSTGRCRPAPAPR